LQGTVTVSGEKYQIVVVDYGCAAALRVTLSGNDVWSDETNANRLANLLAWSEPMLKQPAGGAGLDVIMDPDAFKNFRKNPKVEKRLDLRGVILLPWHTHRPLLTIAVILP